MPHTGIAGDMTPDEPVSRFDVIDPQTISVLVSTFYSTIREHPRLGEIFNRRLDGRWEEHLAKMNLFWQSVLLKNRTYSGRPVPAHQKQTELVSEDFTEWLKVFRSVAHDLFAPHLAQEIITYAERIAQSLWFACLGTAGARLPDGLVPDLKEAEQANA